MKKSSNIAIKLSGVTKQYAVHRYRPTLVDKLAKNDAERFFALNDVSLEIKIGEKIGIIGPNGSGKTTLLKVIAGITAPTGGTVEIHGRVVSLIDLEAGFHPDLTGEQNIYLNGMLLGMKKQEIGKKLKPIIAFADIGNFIDAPLYTYSSGMRLRLGFAVAIHARPEILILDEALAVGDGDFQGKCLRSLHELSNRTTIVLASHQLQQLYGFCDRFYKISGGVLQRDLSPAAIRLLISLPVGWTFAAAAQSNSMFPMIRKGDVLTVKRVPFASIKPNNVIAFWLPKLNELIVHRAIAKTQAAEKQHTFFTQGDASSTHDSWQVTAKNFVGVVIRVRPASRG